MPLIVGLLAGLVFGIASAFAGRRVGTVLACVPLAAWFVIYGIVSVSGLRDDQVAPLCFALLGIVLGLLCGQIVDFRRRRTRSGTQR